MKRKRQLVAPTRMYRVDWRDVDGIRHRTTYGSKRIAILELAARKAEALRARADRIEAEALAQVTKMNPRSEVA